MADLVKRVRGHCFVVGNRVSVPKEFFDIASSTYSESLPAEWNKLHGTVSCVSKLTGVMKVTWDIDNSVSKVYADDVCLEDNDLETQFLPNAQVPTKQVRE